MKAQLSCTVCSNSAPEENARGIFYCPRCRTAFNTAYSPASYDENYFLDDYSRQYGKTYIEDFKPIYSRALNRLAVIKNLAERGGFPVRSLLDLGSAAGFFLKAAQDTGINSLMGLEVSAYAAEYCRREFGIETALSPFAEFSAPRLFDAVSAWFFVEHNENPLEALERMSGMINSPGIIAFSIPSVFGPMFLFRRDEWIRTHPADHAMDMSPRSVRLVLKKLGFNKIVVKPSGVHPERLWPRPGFMRAPFSLLYSMYSGLTAFSDTIDVYAVKQTE